MQFTIAALSFASIASAISVSYDTGYDDASRSLTAVSCSDGANGLITKYGWQTQGAVAGFPRIGGYSGIAGWNSAQVCGQLPFPLSYSLTSLKVRYLLWYYLQRQHCLCPSC